MNPYEKAMAEAVRSLGNQLDFSLYYKGLPKPDNIHLKRNGGADKRYKNWREAEKWIKAYETQKRKDYLKFSGEKE